MNKTTVNAVNKWTQGTTVPYSRDRSLPSYHGWWVGGHKQRRIDFPKTAKVNCKLHSH